MQTFAERASVNVLGKPQVKPVNWNCEPTDSLSISVTETKSSTEKDRDKKDKSKKPSLSLPVLKLSFQRQLYAILLCQCQPVLWDGMSPSEWGIVGTIFALIAVRIVSGAALLMVSFTLSFHLFLCVSLPHSLCIIGSYRPPLVL